MPQFLQQNGAVARSKNNRLIAPIALVTYVINFILKYIPDNSMTNDELVETAIMSEKSFGIIPVRCDNDRISFLLIQHRQGHWGFPKGHAEAGETDVDAACREFTEETGIRDFRMITDKTFSESYRIQKDAGVTTKTVIYYLAVVESANIRIQESEIKDCRWLHYDAAMEMMTFPEGRELLRQANDFLRRSRQLFQGRLKNIARG